MQKLTLLLVVAFVAVAVSVPIFADDVIAAITNEDNDSGNGSVMNNTNNTPLAPEQLQALNDSQTKLTALQAKIESLKATYNNTGNKGLLNALDQFAKQADKLNSQIQNLTAGNGTLEAGAIAGLLNSIQKRVTALEHKISIKEKVLLKQSTKKQSTKKAKIKKSKKHKDHDEDEDEDEDEDHDEDQDEDHDED